MQIVCTAGPKCWDEGPLGSLIDKGLNVLRLNFSHGDHKGHFEVLERFRKVCQPHLMTCHGTSYTAQVGLAV